MPDFLCWKESSWGGIKDALSRPDDGAMILGAWDAEDAAKSYREGLCDDFDNPDEIAVLVQRIESAPPRTYAGRPVIVDVMREAIPAYSAAIRKDARNA